MSPDAIAQIQDLGDLGLACALCLAIEQHGIVLAPQSELDTVAQELAAICSERLGLATVVIECSQGTDVRHFSESILVDPPDYDDDDDDRFANYQRSLGQTRGRAISLDERRIADVIIARNLDLADGHVQLQVIELIRTRRIYTQAAMHSPGKEMMIIALNDVDSEVRMDSFLNDMFAIAHKHIPASGWESDSLSSNQASLSDVSSFRSVVRKRPSHTPHLDHANFLLEEELFSDLRKAVIDTALTAEIAAHLQNIVVFMRLHRYVAGGVSALASRHFRLVAKAMAVLQGIDFVSPAIVALAARKTYLHRLILADASTERSLRWGSDPVAVYQNMQDVTIEDAIDAVIASVQAPI